MIENNKHANPNKRGETESVARACRLLAVLEENHQPLRLRDLVELTGIDKATAFRLLGTLLSYGLIFKSGNEYRPAIERLAPRSMRLGYAAQTDEFAFSRSVTESITTAASNAGCELVMLNNDYSPTVALKNVESLIKENVQLVMEFQTDSSIAAFVSAKLAEKHLPLIAIEIPHPGATYFGANNIQAGLMAGRHLGRWVLDNWKGQLDDLILLGLPMAGSLPGSRLTGSLLGIREIIPLLADSQVHELSADGRFMSSYEIVKKHLTKNKHRRILVSAINDPSALGALEAFREAGRLQHCAIVGQNASSDALHEMSRPNTRLVGSVGYFPEKYGEQLIALARQLLAHKPVPQAVFVKHHMVTPGNLQNYYSIQKR